MRLKVLLMIAVLAVILLVATAVPALATDPSSSCAVAGGAAACAGPSASCAVAGDTAACAVSNFFRGLFDFFFNPFGLFF